MSATQRTNWFWTDWLGDPAVRRLTPAERGVWIDLLGIAAGASPVGYVCDDRGRALTLEEIARITNAGSPDEASKLIDGILDKGVASRDRAGRLFNRRMVRDAENAAKKTALAEKRKASGRSGGFATKLKWQGLQTLPQQNAQHLPRQLPQQTLVNPLPSKNITSSLPSTAREQSKTAGSLASAPCDGALTRPPSTEQAEESGQPKRVDQLTKADLDAVIEKRRSASPSPDDLEIPGFLRRTA